MAMPKFLSRTLLPTCFGLRLHLVVRFRLDSSVWVAADLVAQNDTALTYAFTLLEDIAMQIDFFLGEGKGAVHAIRDQIPLIQ